MATIMASRKLQLEHAEVQRFHSLAWRHFEAAEVLFKQLSPFERSNLATESVYLGGYGAECILKAKLLSKTKAKRHKRMVETEFPKTIGHDLELITRLLEKGKKAVVFDDDVASTFARIRRTWTSTLRYSPKLFTTDEARWFLSNVRFLLKWAEGGTP